MLCDIVYSPTKYRKTEGEKSDKAKGIVAKPMPREWYDWHAVEKIEDEERREFYFKLVVDKKPYFMRYIYPDLLKQYNQFIKNTTKSVLREFGMTIDELLAIPEDKLTERQYEFIYYYKKGLPVGVNDCVLNIICRRFEQEFDGFKIKCSEENAFDYTIMKSGIPYKKSQYTAVIKIYNEFNQKLKNFAVHANIERIDKFDMMLLIQQMRDDFCRECLTVCSNKYVLCDIILDICYKRNATKRFAWEICSDEIIENLLNRNNRIISFPVMDDVGDISYCGNKFSIHRKELIDIDDNIE